MTRESDEQYYQRYYRQAQIDGDANMLSMYPRSDPDSPRRFRADTNCNWVPLVVGIAGSMVLTPFGGIALGWLCSEAIKKLNGAD